MSRPSRAPRQPLMERWHRASPECCTRDSRFARPTAAPYPRIESSTLSSARCAEPRHAVQNAHHVIAFHLQQELVPVCRTEHLLVLGRGPRNPVAPVAIESAVMMVQGAINFELHAFGDLR